MLFNRIEKSLPKQILLLILTVMFIFWTFIYLLVQIEEKGYLSSFIGIFLWSLNLLIYPLYYLYIISLTREGFYLRRIHLLIFLPAIIFFLIFVSIFTINFIAEFTSQGQTHNLRYEFIRSNYRNAIMIVYKILLFFNLLQFVFYSLLMLIALMKHRKKIREFFSYEENINLKWFYYFLIIYFIFHSIDIYNDFYKYGGSKNYYFTLFILGIRYTYITFLGIFGVRQQDIYVKSRPPSRNHLNQGTVSIPVPQPSAEPELISKQAFVLDINDEIDKHYFLLTDKQKQNLMSRIEDLMHDKKVFKHPQLSVLNIASELNTNTRYISLAINDIKNINFNVYINTFRVREAEELLKSRPDLRIEDIMYECGFNSKSSFNNSFKAITGLSPSEYRKKIK